MVDTQRISLEEVVRHFEELEDPRLEMIVYEKPTLIV
jgi:hypothetical protein